MRRALAGAAATRGGGVGGGGGGAGGGPARASQIRLSRHLGDARERTRVARRAQHRTARRRAAAAAAAAAAPAATPAPVVVLRMGQLQIVVVVAGGEMAGVAGWDVGVAGSTRLQIVVVVAGRRAAQVAVADGVGGAAGQRVGDHLPLEAKRLDLCASGMCG